MIKTLSTVAVTAILGLAGCHDTNDHGQTTGMSDTPDYAGTHYNPVVNSTGSGIGRDDPAIKPSAGDATGRVNAAGGGQSLNSGSGNLSAGSAVGGSSSGTGSSSGR